MRKLMGFFRATLISAASWFALWLFQNFDFFTIIDKYGFPTAVAVVMFIFFQRQLARTANALTDQQKLTDGYRKETLDEARSQTEFLRKLLNEAKVSNICKFEQKP